MRKVLVLLCFGLFLGVAFFYYEERPLPVFLIANDETIITKGHYGAVLIVEITYLQKELDALIIDPSLKNALFVVDAAFLARAPEHIELLIQHNRQVGLRLSPNQDVETQVAAYEQAFQRLPLWAMVNDREEVAQFNLQALQINLISPSLTLANAFPKQIATGEFVHLALTEKDALKLEPFLAWLQTQKFLSIEESLFGYTTTQKKYP